MSTQVHSGVWAPLVNHHVHINSSASGRLAPALTAQQRPPVAAPFKSLLFCHCSSEAVRTTGGPSAGSGEPRHAHLTTFVAIFRLLLLYEHQLVSCSEFQAAAQEARAG